MSINYDYTKLAVKDIIEGNKFKVPSFQRNVVWSKSKRKDFVKNIMEGNPFGSILVYQERPDKYVLIDGLQRVSTIKDFIKNPYDYVDYVLIEDEYVENMIKRDYELKNNIVYDKTKEENTIKEIKKEIYDLLKKGKDSIAIKYQLFKSRGFLNDETIERNIINCVDAFEEKLKIQELIIPTIIYTGDKEKLPDIFYNLNTGGVNLTKYETFSSIWDDKKYLVNDQEIVDKIIEKYENLRKNSDLEIEVTANDIYEKGITLFEYCYSISEILRDENKNYTHIIGDNKKSTDPIGFDLLTLLSGNPVNKAEVLDEVFKGTNAEFLVKLKKVIVNTFEVLTQSLDKWITGINGTINNTESSYMIYHMFISYIKHNYSIDFKKFTIESIDDGRFNKGFKENLHMHYLFDYISDYWKINRQVSDLSREIESNSINKYSKEIPRNDWLTLLDTTFREDQLNNSTNVISMKTKYFLDFLVKFKINENRNYEKYFKSDYVEGNFISIDFEHIVPQQYFKELFGDKVKNYPVSCIGNICYLAAKDNRSKKEKTLYEDVDSRPSFILDNEYLDLIDYPGKDELSFIKYPADDFDKYYKEFLRDRVDYLISEFKKYI